MKVSPFLIRVLDYCSKIFAVLAIGYFLLSTEGREVQGYLYISLSLFFAFLNRLLKGLSKEKHTNEELFWISIHLLGAIFFLNIYLTI